MRKTFQLKHIFFVLIIPLFILQCDKESVETDLLNNRLKTVSHDEALDFFNSFNNSQAQQRNASEPYVTVYMDYMGNVDINNSNEKLTVIEAQTTNSNSYSRVLLLNIDGQIESIVYSMFSSNDFSTENFYGDIIVTDLEGDFITGFKMEDGYYIAKYYNNSDAGAVENRTAYQGRSSNDCVFSDPSWCDLDAVVITVRKKNIELGNLYTSIVPEGDNFTEEIDAGPSAGGGGGGLNSTSCGPGKVYDHILQDCVQLCNFGFQDRGDGCERVDCDTKKEDLKTAFPSGSDADLEELKNIINEFGKGFGIDSKEKLQHFLAQAAHETGGFGNLGVTESLYYTSASRLVAIYPKYFSETDNLKRDPNDYLRNSQKVANYVYASRLGNGNEASGDGYKYRGHGIFQLTGKSNFREFQNFYNDKYSPSIDIIANPSDLTTNKKIATISALWFYKEKVLDKLTVDTSTTVREVTRKVNGGDNGLADREDKFNDAKDNIDCL